MAERVQPCKNCGGTGWAFDYKAGYSPPPWSGCTVCYGTGEIRRTGPYRLQDGTWSDGVDRSKPINLRATSNRWEVTAGMNASYVWHKAYREVEFDTWEEAIAYADKAARRQG